MSGRNKNLWERIIKPAVDLLTLVVSLVGLASIWIAINEMKTSEELSWITTYQTIETASLEMDKLLVEHPTLVPYFLSGKSIQNNDHAYNQPIALADARIGAIDAILTYASFRHADAKIVGWQHTFSSYLHNSPLMCERLKINSDYYGLINSLGKAACGGGPEDYKSPALNLVRDPIRCLTSDIRC